MLFKSTNLFKKSSVFFLSTKYFILKSAKLILKRFKLTRSVYIQLLQSSKQCFVLKPASTARPLSTGIGQIKHTVVANCRGLFVVKTFLSTGCSKDSRCLFCTGAFLEKVNRVNFSIFFGKPLFSKVGTPKSDSVTRNMHSVLGELKYRVLYVGLLCCCLTGLVYLNLGLYIEFQWAYYFNYYQFIDFDWSEGVLELNKSLHPKGAATNLSCTKEVVSSLNPFYERSISASQALVDNWLNTPLEDKKVGSNTMHPIGTHYEKVNVEIDEFKYFFISNVSYFSSQHPLPLLELTGATQVTSEITQITNGSHLFSLYIMLVFYQLTTFLVYHCFCFLSPAVLNQYRISLLRLLQMALTVLLLHFLALPYIVATNQELQIEGIDSELFFAANLDLLNCWVWSFYILLMFLTMLCFYRVIKANYNKTLFFTSTVEKRLGME